MADLITLGVEVQTTGGAQAAQGLGAFQKAAQGAAGAADKLENQVNALGAAQTKSAAPARSMAGAMNGLGSAFKNNSGAIQNTSFQLQDIIVQMEMGTSVTRTLGQQLPQLLGGFGPLGAVIGVVAGALLSFAPALFSSAEKAVDLKTATEDLADAMGALRTATEGMEKPFADLRAQYGDSAMAARELLTLQQQLAENKATTAFSAATASVLDQMGPLLASLDIETSYQNALDLNTALADQAVLQAQIAEVQAGTSTLNDVELEQLRERKSANEELFAQLDQYRLSLKGLAAAFGISEKNAASLAVVMATVASADTTQQRVEATQKLAVLIGSVTHGLETASPAGIELYEALLLAAQAGLDILAMSTKTTTAVEEGGDAATVVAGETETVAANLATAASNAGALADGLSRALGAAVSLAQQSFTARVEAEIKLKYAGDPVATAGALAASRFDRTGAGEMMNAPTGAGDFTRNLRAEYIANEVAAAEAQLALADFNKEVKGGASGAKAAATDIKRYYDATRTDAEKYADGLKELGALHSSGAMDADLYARSIEDLNLKFDPLGKLISELSDTVENELNAAFASVLDGTKSLGEALLDFAGNVLAKVAQDLFAQQFSKPIAEGIKAFISSEDGNVFGRSGYVPFANGGVVSGPTIFPFANGTGLMGEAGPEAIMPLSRGSDGKLGVVAANGNSAPKITINNYSGQEASASSDNMGNIIVEIGRAVAQDITAGGPTYRAIKSTFGISNRLQQRG